MPPTSDALGFHLMRAFYQFIVWRSAAKTEPDMPPHTDPGAGWFLKDGELLTLTMSKDAIPKANVKNISCQCNSGRGTERCKCFKTGLRFRPTRLCHKEHLPGVCGNNV